jgi:superfamily II DNA or RNA helicase
MCQSIEQGGKRCAAHTRPPYAALMSAMDDAAAKAPFAPAKAGGRKKARDRFTAVSEVEGDGTLNALNVVANHASTPQGAKEVARDLERFKAERDMQTVAWLTSCQKFGTERSEAAKETTAAIKKAVEKAKRAETGSRMELKRSSKATPEWNMATVFPGVAERWDTEKNEGILPTEVTPNTNGSIWLKCEQGHSWDGGRGNNIVVPIKAGKRYFPICPECEGRRPRLFARTQSELTSLADALGDPDAFNALPPALQYAVMNELNILRGSDDSMSRQVGMSIVNGNLTLKDVMLAADPKALEGKLDERLDDEGTLTNITDMDVTSSETNDGKGVEVDQILASAGVLALVPAESDLAASITRANNELLWERAYDAEIDPNESLDTYIAYLDSRRGASTQGDAAIDRFIAEARAVQSFELPEGYVTERLNKFGEPVTMDPDLSQRRFALMAAEQRAIANWSGTGAGKTLSTVLAIQNDGARETLVVCPKAVREEWENEFKAGFPTTSEVIVVNDPEDFNKVRPEPAEGVNRVWVVNYDKFSGTPQALAKTIGPLAERVDALVFDEIHMAKASSASETDASKRHRAIVRFRDRAEEANPGLMVVGASATPVVNNLEEAKSVLRIIEGPNASGPAFSTTPTIKNAANAHYRIAAAGVRRVMKYPTALTREDVTIDVTANVHQIQGRINQMRKSADGTSKAVHPAMMERALLPEKLPKIASIASQRKANGEGGTIVYTEYTEGMVSPIRGALEAEGLRVGTFTGDDTPAERTAALKAFRNGEIDVIIGSQPIATGVDGLQAASNHAVVASMAWTAAADDQFVGRIHRRGQVRDSKVTYLLTEAKVGDGKDAVRWSWCKDNRQSRVKFKRDVANAAVDGVLPSGALDSQQHSAEKALGALKDLTAALAKASVTQKQVTLTA